MSSERTTRWILFMTVVGVALGGFLFLLGYETAARIVFAAVAVVPVVPQVREMIAKLRRRQPGVDVIALLAVSAALVLGEFLTAAIIGVMLATGRFLERAGTPAPIAPTA